ncbi:MmcQ/YjbR family DNA-binding protein [Brachybacterium saurashtrense]|uniref:MmcQ/YjbR family DNA-binding protein n=1 Tax=Brachybacterium saurashtrense TaxID=556288 RepID=A0A345YS74_9MICO|nr:MmcQ/YjbR family DNA-binding protein [Brachybacterium saurashtrense]RRR22491.1 MmcQ/YjbR family DNA-binding protein [Brachybacterium saurashtrense]
MPPALLDPAALHEIALGRALELPAARLERPFGPDAEVVKVLGKMFVLATELRGAPIVVLKADPRDAEMLCEHVAGISPGYHMNKRHWITVEAGAGVDAALLEELVTDAYRLVVATLPRRLRPIDPETFEAPGTAGTDGSSAASGLLETSEHHAPPPSDAP